MSEAHKEPPQSESGPVGHVRAIDKVVHALYWRAGLRPALGVPTLGAPPESAPHPDWRVQSGPEARAPDFVNGLVGHVTWTRFRFAQKPGTVQNKRVNAEFATRR